MSRDLSEVEVKAKSFILKPIGRTAQPPLQPSDLLFRAWLSPVFLKSVLLVLLNSL